MFRRIATSGGPGRMGRKTRELVHHRGRLHGQGWSAPIDEGYCEAQTLVSADDEPGAAVRARRDPEPVHVHGRGPAVRAAQRDRPLGARGDHRPLDRRGRGGGWPVGGGRGRGGRGGGGGEGGGARQPGGDGGGGDPTRGGGA